MKIEPIDGGRLRVWLSRREIRRCRLDRDEYDRRAVKRLVRHVLSEGGYPLSAGTVAEMIPVAEGWVLLVSTHDVRSQQAAVYYFQNKDILTAFSTCWERAGDTPTGALYGWGDGYALVVYGDEILTPRHRGLLEEYGQLWGSGEPLAAHIAEYGHLLSAGFALTVDGHGPPAEPD